MKTYLLHRLLMTPRLKAIDEKAECLAQDYMGWELLEVDDSAEERDCKIFCVNGVPV